MSFLKEIRKQPEHIRKLMFGLSIITTLSFMGIIWFNSFQKTLIALMDTEIESGQNIAQNADSRSLFGNIGQSFLDLTKSMKATIGGFLDDESGSVDVKENTEPNIQSSAHPLPLSE
ncbi:MAG: hypothetical protein A3G02_01925 [Candidatus Yanofskybacteria bacterium RIFCSPLOWO2_12_FULL_44_13b]|nr:MAG: hypothetical protein UW14_C0016G0014 [Candidatus Yanofskybacteria bacterium GW2011_GWA2_44_10]OGN02821.1 MAG: hypothetical protein A2657_00975 [Candidatus Yanofskybacteria bacterium RIFCSPHIGHO2_01_FULL_44_110b]OGN14921.1 MAG: hypothetical protein A3C01_02335 [Candidatus Yanofskybacteria bacterium RIFCSPHIGHO2_02_FULL_44_36b]OGN18776.1 MAG: hypothetical protein A3F50_02730 [Candidatus Yanofskybacteria bacterium RIFCSPHIGHO2_12_FULL_44_29b]OGN26118.1 MAG: hypothetical protein A3B12_01765